MSAPNGQSAPSTGNVAPSGNLPPVAPSASNNNSNTGGTKENKEKEKERGSNLTIAIIQQDRDSQSDRQSAPATPASPASSTTSSASTISTRDISEVKEPPVPILPLDENGVPILFQTALYEGHHVEYEEISVPPLYEDHSKGPIRLKVPKEYLQYKPSPGYVGSSNVVFLNFQDMTFYEKAALLPNPILTVWMLCPHKTFNKTESGNSYVKKRIIEEAYRQNIQVKAVNPDKFDLQVSKHGYGTMVYEGQQLPLPDCAISRVGASVGYFGLAVLRQLESLSVTVFNDVRSIEVSRDKLYTHQVLAGNGVPIPKTVLGKFPIEYDFIQRHFGYPVILKRTSGSKGDQVWKLDSKEQLQELEMRVEDKDKPYIFQEYLAHTKGRDIRAFVIGDRVSATMMRVAAKGQFKANVHQGGTVKPTKLKKPLQAMVLKTAKLCGLEYAGVDVLLDKDGYKICEVNSSPGFEGLERASGVNVGKDLVDYMRAKMEVLGKTRKEIVEDIVPIQEDHLRLGTELAEASAVSVTAASVGDPSAPSAAVSLFNVPPPTSQNN